MMWPGNAFKRSEFACKCGCGFDTVDAELLRVLDDLRLVIRGTIVIHSGCRCDNRNESVGGKVRSKHMEGRAADISSPVKTPKELRDYLCGRYPDTYGIGLYNTFVHIDTRTGCARWAG